MANRLANETSPYLLQHADDPVDWYPWGEEAFRAARDEDKPILLSIGYSACHWCHVMARECFEDEQIAAQLNEGFVCVKVDREERPDVDQLYQAAMRVMGEAGGWPLTLFLTPEREPFFGGTFFPRHPRGGLPGFSQVLTAVRRSFLQRRSDADSIGKQVREQLAAHLARGIAKGGEPPTREEVIKAGERIAAGVDAAHGGVGKGARFPMVSALLALLRAHRRGADPQVLERALLTLDRMATGGIYDQIGGGFFRYTVDEEWSVPHFEKLLADNAQLVGLYTEAWQLTRVPEYARVVSETIAWLERELSAPGGAFCASLDADTEGVEGKFYLWTRAEIDQLLPPERAELVAEHFGISTDGNFEPGLSVPRYAACPEDLAKKHGRPRDETERELSEARKVLYAARERRVHPGRDEKILAGWNGLAIGAIARAARAFGRPEWAVLAKRAADFVLRELFEGGVLWRSYRDGARRVEGRLEDYGDLAEGLIDLYMATFDPAYLESAAQLAEAALDLFWDEDAGAFLSAPPDGDGLIAPVYALTDEAAPSGASSLSQALVRLTGLTSEPRYIEAAWEYLGNLREAMLADPVSFGRLLCAADTWLDGAATLVIAGDAAQARPLLDELGQRYEPTLSVIWSDPSGPPPHPVRHTVAGKKPLDGAAGVYLCRNRTCQRPREDLSALDERL